jgi:hypothetical protein
MDNDIKPKSLRKGERISRVKNHVTGDVFFTSNLYEKYINGELYVGVFTKSDDYHQRKVNWMRKDTMVKIKER